MIKKSTVIEKLVNIPKPAPKFFWPREMKILNSLLNNYPIEFLAKLTLPRKVSSLSAISAANYKNKLEEKFKIYSKQIAIDKPTEKDYNVCDTRVAEQSEVKTKPTLRNFLDE